VHNAHLAMARAALEQLGLDKVLFVPTGNPRYRTPAAASGEQRVAMLKLALADEPRFEVDARELSPGASGYTVDTLRELRLELGTDTELWMLIGADQYASLESWHRPQDVKRLAKLGVFGRPGVALDARVSLVPMQPMRISSSEVRARIARGKDISTLMPPAVAHHIAAQRLYA
jgi:nicotinate-nucleotide adenylyltransferase